MSRAGSPVGSSSSPWVVDIIRGIMLFAEAAGEGVGFQVFAQMPIIPPRLPEFP